MSFTPTIIDEEKGTTMTSNGRVYCNKCGHPKGNLGSCACNDDLEPYVPDTESLADKRDRERNR